MSSLLIEKKERFKKHGPNTYRVKLAPLSHCKRPFCCTWFRCPLLAYLTTTLKHGAVKLTNHLIFSSKSSSSSLYPIPGWKKKRNQPPPPQSSWSLLNHWGQACRTDPVCTCASLSRLPFFHCYITRVYSRHFPTLSVSRYIPSQFIFPHLPIPSQPAPISTPTSTPTPGKNLQSSHTTRNYPHRKSGFFFLIYVHRYTCIQKKKTQDSVAAVW